MKENHQLLGDVGDAPVATAHPFADPGLWSMLCSDPPDTWSLTAEDRRDDAVTALGCSGQPEVCQSHSPQPVGTFDLVSISVLYDQGGLSTGVGVVDVCGGGVRRSAACRQRVGG